MLTDEASPIHEPTDDDAWQESMALYWCDPAAGVGGALAFGGWANRGQAITWYGVFDSSRGVGFQRTRPPFPLAPGDRAATSIGCGGLRFERDAEGRLSVRAEDEETGTLLELELEDFYPMSPWPHANAAALASQASGHLEASGQATGRLVLDGRDIEVRPLYHRDGSWGPRTTQPMTAYSWSVGSCGPSLSWSALVLNIAGLPALETAFVAIDGELVPATSVRTLVTVDHDALTVRSWSTIVGLPDGSALDVDASPVGHLFDHRAWPDVVATDTIARARASVGGQTYEGFAGLNRIVNPRLGTGVPSSYLGGSATDGIFRT
ncbi:MAG: hypothetical protein QOK06_1683 [Acidimicrobiaceae bacterium]